MWVIRRVQAHVLLYLSELDSCQKEWFYSVFFLPIPKAKQYLSVASLILNLVSVLMWKIRSNFPPSGRLWKKD